MHKLLLTFLSLATSSALTAQTNDVTYLSDVNVQASSENSRLPEFSTSTTVLDSEVLEAREAHHLQDALGMVPNLNAAGGTSRPRYFQMRGVGENSHFANEGPPNFSVGFLIDDIDLSGLGMAASLFDVQNVEVLRGPQATVYGSKALAGLININTKAPTPYRDSHLQASVGTDDYLELGVATGGAMNPENPEWMYRFSFNAMGSNGYRDNDYLDRDDTNQRREYNGRLKFRYQPDDMSTVDLTLLGAVINNGYDAFSVKGDGFTMYSDEPGEDDQDVLGASLRATLKRPRTFDLISITSGTAVDSTYSYDADWANDEFWASEPYFFDPVVEGWRYSFFEILERERKAVSQEFRFLGKDDRKLFGDTTRWSAGLVTSWLNEKDDYIGFDELHSDYEATTAAGYGQLNSALTEKLELIGSLRLENRDTDYSDDRGEDFDTSDLMPGGRVSLEYALSPVSHAFGTISRGFKGSGVNQDPAVPEELRKYDPEYIWNYETGLRSSWADGKGQGSLVLFYMDREDLQITSSIQSDPGNPSAFSYYTGNAAEGYNYGLEADFRHPVSQTLNLFGSVGLLETSYSEFDDAGGSNNVEDREQPHAPGYTFLIGADIDLRRGWFARAEIEGKDAFYFSDGHDQQSEAYELLNLKFGYARDTWSISIWGRNVLDNSYDTRGFYFGQEPPDYPEKSWTMKGDAAQFGVTWRQVF